MGGMQLLLVLIVVIAAIIESVREIRLFVMTRRGRWDWWLRRHKTGCVGLVICRLAIILTRLRLHRRGGLVCRRVIRLISGRAV
jgi:hypothetical protein